MPATDSNGESGLVARLTLEQKIRLLTGADNWTVHGEHAVGLRPMVLSDGPAGVRGTRYDPANPSSSLPCPVALAATWDEALVERVALGLGREARTRGVDVVLGPTINLVRTPLSGRGFECFSEDPLLTARIAVAYVRGMQAAGVGASAKHYVGNDSETDRRYYDARIAERVLRELYLPPFEACVAEADVAMVMAAYNSVNGAAMTANPVLLGDLLKTEWGFRGVVVSDWSAARTTVSSARAGLDLVMPGPDGPWGELLVAAVRAGAVTEAQIDDKVVRLLQLARRVGAFAEPNGHGPRALVEAGLLCEAAGRSFVLLRNRDAVLPLKPYVPAERATDAASARRVSADPASGLRSVALIGPNATRPQTQGGGSVRVLPVVRPSLVASLRAGLGATELSVHDGCRNWTSVPMPEDGGLRDPLSGEPGVRVEVRDIAGTVLHDVPLPTSELTWWDDLAEAVNRPGSEVLMHARYRADADGPHMLGVAGVGRFRVSVDGDCVAEVTTLHPAEVVEAFSRPPELRIPLRLQAGEEVELLIEHRPEVRERGPGFVMMRLGVAPAPDEEELVAAAVEAAAAADVAVVVVGSADGTESEGYDRETLALPGRQDELVRRVAAANPRTVVVVNSGMPVLMPWVEDVAAVLQVWFPGQAFGEALADCLVGAVEPGGRLPVSVPRAEADSPVLRAHPEAGELPYAEGLLVGYRGYDRSGIEPLFRFGHGLGYTDWQYEKLGAAGSVAAGEDLPVTVTVRNSGGRAGREVVQVYLEGPDDDPGRPLRTLAAFTTVSAGPGEQVEVLLRIPARSFARFDEGRLAWVWQPGRYVVHAGRSSGDLGLRTEVVMD